MRTFPILRHLRSVPPSLLKASPKGEGVHPSQSGTLSSTSPPECSAAPVSARPSNAPSPSGRVAATVLVLGLLLLWSTPAEAQTARILVSNVSQGGDDEVNLSGNDHAQLFHTGASNTGWVLTSLTVVAENAEDFDVEICEADDTTELPTSTCTELTRPGSFAAGSLEFTYDGFLILSANDNYLAVFKQDGSENVTLDSTTNSGEDATGLSDWSIKNKFDWNNGGTWQHKGREQRGDPDHRQWLSKAREPGRHRPAEHLPVRGRRRHPAGRH